jgi:homoserine O-acetyltransferase
MQTIHVPVTVPVTLSEIKLYTTVSFENGETYVDVPLAFQTWGKLNETASNVVWVCHALTGNHRVQEWWDGLFGPGKFYDPKDHFIVAVNVFGSAYGSFGPTEPAVNGKTLYRKFPVLTIRDMVQGLEAVRNYLKIDRIATLIGASVGGQQAMEWAIQQPDVFQKVVLIATNAYHSPFGIAFNEAQRLAIQADATFFEDVAEGGQQGLVAARAIGMLSYRTYEGFGLTQCEEDANKTDAYKAASYQKYQGEKLAKRFNAYSYWYLSKAMDSHHVGRKRGRVEQVLKSIQAETLVIGIDSDLLFPLSEQQFLAEHIPRAKLATLQSAFGHDGFLVEYDQLLHHLNAFYND